MKIYTLVIIMALIVVLGFVLPWQKLLPGLFGGDTHTVSPMPSVIETFDDCVKAGNPVMESYPEQCRTQDGRTFTRYIGNELEKVDMIRIASPRPNTVVTSPLVVSGEARGMWFFEASFPIVLTDWNGLIIGEGIATADGEWMTEEFVPFTATIIFTKPALYPERGTLMLQKDNPSGLPEHDDALEIPVRFE